MQKQYSNETRIKTHLPRVLHICDGELGSVFSARLLSKPGLSDCQLDSKTNFSEIRIEIKKIIHENAFETVVCERVAMSLRENVIRIICTSFLQQLTAASASHVELATLTFVKSVHVPQSRKAILSPITTVIYHYDQIIQISKQIGH